MCSDTKLSGTSLPSKHLLAEAATEVFCNSQEKTCVRVAFLIKLQASAQAQTLAQVFSHEFFKISKNTFFTEHLWVSASVPVENQQMKH